jgi:hypothetical protein
MRQRGAEQTDWGHYVPRVCVSQRGREKQTSWYCIALLCPRNYFTCSTAHSKKKKNVKNRRNRNICRGHLPRPGTSGCRPPIRKHRRTKRHPQIAELAEYIAQSRPEPERAPYVQSIRQKLTVEDGQTPLSEDVARRREAFSVVFGDVKGLGEGSERGCVPTFIFLSLVLSSHSSWEQRSRGSSTCSVPIY